jgi:uncharacterized protein YbaP (TraB family)
VPNDWGSYQQLSAIKDLQASLDRIKSNDLAHINTRLNKMDIKLASMGTSLSWLTKLAVVLTGAMVAGTIAVVLKYIGII